MHDAGALPNRSLRPAVRDTAPSPRRPGFESPGERRPDSGTVFDTDSYLNPETRIPRMDSLLGPLDERMRSARPETVSPSRRDRPRGGCAGMPPPRQDPAAPSARGRPAGVLRIRNPTSNRHVGADASYRGACPKTRVARGTGNAPRLAPIGRVQPVGTSSVRGCWFGCLFSVLRPTAAADRRSGDEGRWETRITSLPETVLRLVPFFPADHPPSARREPGSAHPSPERRDFREVVIDSTATGAPCPSDSPTPEPPP